MIWFIFYFLFENALGLWQKLYSYWLLGLLLEVYCCWSYLEVTNVKGYLVQWIVKKYKTSLSSSILYYNLFFNGITNPAMPTRYRFRPINLTSLSLSINWYLKNPITRYNKKLILIIIQIYWSKSYRNNNRHTWCNVSRFLFRIFDLWNNKLFLLERCYFYSLYASWIINQFDFRLINMMSVIVAEEYFLRLDFEFGLWCIRSKGLCVGESLSEMSWVFSKGYFLIHALCDLMIIDLLLNIQFGQL